MTDSLTDFDKYSGETCLHGQITSPLVNKGIKINKVKCAEFGREIGRQRFLDLIGVHSQEISKTKRKSRFFFLSFFLNK